MAADEPPDQPLFETIDWAEHDGRRPGLTLRSAGFLLSLLVVAGLFYYDYSGMGGYFLIGRWNPVQIEWLYVLSLVMFVFAVVVPAVQNRQLTRRYWRRFRQNRLAVAALAYLGVIVVIGTAGPPLAGRPSINLLHQNQPPLGFTVERGTVALQCLSETVGTDAHPRCAGTWQHPLGTNQDGKDTFNLFFVGARVTLLVGLVAGMLIGPIATIVGTVAGYIGGLVDDVLMGYVDIQQTVPAFVVYVILIFLLERSLFLVVVVFGLLSWGGTARLVRSDVRKRREELYVTVARSQGASHLDVVRRHLLPNVSSTVITSTIRLVPLLILTEAAIAYLGLGDAILYSWGAQIADGGISVERWWITLFPTFGLGTTVLAFGIVGDALRDAIDPKGEP